MWGEEVQNVRKSQRSHNDITSFPIRSNFWVKEDRELRADIEELQSWVVYTVTIEKANREGAYPGRKWEFSHPNIQNIPLFVE